MLGSRILCLQGMRIMMFRLSGFYYRGLGSKLEPGTQSPRRFQECFAHWESEALDPRSVHELLQGSGGTWRIIGLSK